MKRIEVAMNELIDELKGRIAESLKLEAEKLDSLDPTAPLFGDGLGLDSIDALELVVMLEKHYGIRITDMNEGREALASLEAMADFVTKNRAEN